VEHLDDVPVERLQEALDDVDGKKSALRLLAAIAYRNGVSQTELAEWYGVDRRTIYNWLSRLDADEPLEQAVVDDRRSGRSRKLSDEERAAFEARVREPPSEAGVAASSWTPALVRWYLADRYDLEYSLPSCRRLLKEAGLEFHEREGRRGEWRPA
jgi:transposase